MAGWDGGVEFKAQVPFRPCTTTDFHGCSTSSTGGYARVGNAGGHVAAARIGMRRFPRPHPERKIRGRKATGGIVENDSVCRLYCAIGTRSSTRELMHAYNVNNRSQRWARRHRFSPVRVFFKNIFCSPIWCRGFLRCLINAKYGVPAPRYSSHAPCQKPSGLNAHVTSRHLTQPPMLSYILAEGSPS